MKSKWALLIPILWAALPVYGSPAQKIRFKTSDNQTLVGSYTAPLKDQPVVVMLHGLGSAKEEWNPLIQVLSAKGIGSLAYDARGHGESSLSKDTNGNANGYQSFTRRGPGSEWEKMVEDVGAALRFLEVSYHISRKKIVLAGASIGGNIVIQYASLSGSVPRTMALSPGQNYQELKPEMYLDRCKGASVLLVASAADNYAFQSCQMFKQRWPWIQLWTDVRPGHGVQMFDASLLSRLTAWIMQKP